MNKQTLNLESKIRNKVDYKRVMFALHCEIFMMHCTTHGLFTEMNLVLRKKCPNIYLKQVYYNK